MTCPRASWKSCSATSPDRKSTRLNSSHPSSSYAVFCLNKKSERTVIEIGQADMGVRLSRMLDANAPGVAALGLAERTQLAGDDQCMLDAALLKNCEHAI